MGRLACIFPGQGSQSVGMGRQLYETEPAARETLEIIDKVAGRSLTGLCFQGPEGELRRTINTQPAILAVSLAAWQCYQALSGPSPDFVAGHSLGEFAALAAAKVIPLESTVRLVVRRAELMEACPPGAMSAVIGLDGHALEDLCCEVRECRDGGLHSGNLEGVVVVANFNTREQVVISGSPYAVSRAGDMAKDRGARVIPLPVGGAFHSPLMAAAAKEFEVEIEKYKFDNALFPVVQNYDANVATAADIIKSKLSKQMPNPVRWCQTIEYMLAQGVDTFVEVGPGKALSGMVKKIDKSARVFNICDKASLAHTLEALKQALRI